MESSNAFEEIAPPSTSASKKVPYDVFINHRGIDTKDTLASSIYTALHRMGLRVFLDANELDPGDFIPSQIQEAMNSSFLHIAILSPYYAHSPWCLAELSFMIKTCSTIIPVFFNVKPGDVRHVKGVFADAFAEYERKNKYTPQKLQEWKQALHNISFRSGQIVKDNDDEGKLLQSIVNSVMKYMKRNIQLEVAKHPVGFDETIYEFERRVFDSSKKVQIVGIVGIGGSGKTTLAKEIYNRKISSIDKHSFLFDVRDAAYKNDLHNRQKKLMQDIGINAGPFDNVQEGKGILRHYMRSLQVLIILDDVDQPEQLDVLLPCIDNLDHGSLIIVTSRELGVLKSWGISSIYQMKRLNLIHSSELLCWHTFLQPSPQNEFRDLVEKFVQICNGLPLSLKVFGGLLRGKSKEYWDSQLHKASRILPDAIKERLKISFDALDEEEQEIFLDIACFFIGEEKSLAIAVWDGSGWSGVHSWEVLANKCLVEVDEHNQIRMHDQLRDLAREIARGRSPFRVWSIQQIKDIQKRTTENVLIRGIKAATDDFYEECSSYNGTPFEECMELVRCCATKFKGLTPSILVVKGNTFTEEFATLLPALLWLRWVNFPKITLPSWLLLKNLRVLELPNAIELEELWSDIADPPSDLTELNLKDVKSFLRFPSTMRCLKRLKKITLDPGACASTPMAYNPIDSLSEEFCLLESLECIQLKACSKITSLPNEFGLLTNLRHLDLSYCRKLKTLPDSFKQLTNLQHINFHGCKELTITSENSHMLENMTKLEILDFSACGKLQRLPHHTTNKLSLRYLNLIGTNLRELPSNIGELTKLEELNIQSECMTRLPASIVNLSSLTTLHISCNELKYLPELMGHLSSLSSLEIVNCEELGTLPESIGHLSSLTNLHIAYCDCLESLPESIDHLFALTSLSLFSCDGLKTLPESISRLSSLTRFHISRCHGLQALPESMGNLSSLTRIHISDCPELKTLPESMGHLSSLTNLDIISCHGLKTLPESVRHLPSLISLHIFNCDGLKDCRE